MAVGINPYTIQDIKNPSEEIKKLAAAVLVGQKQYNQTNQTSIISTQV